SVVNGLQNKLNLISGPNVTISDDRAGNITISGTSGSSSPGGSDQQIQFNQSGRSGGDGSFVFDYTHKIIGVGPSVTAYVPFSSNPMTVPTVHIATGTPFFFQPGLQPVLGGGATQYTGIGLSSTFTDYAPPYGAA